MTLKLKIEPLRAGLCAHTQAHTHMHTNTHTCKNCAHTIYKCFLHISKQIRNIHMPASMHEMAYTHSHTLIAYQRTPTVHSLSDVILSLVMIYIWYISWYTWDIRIYIYIYIRIYIYIQYIRFTYSRETLKTYPEWHHSNQYYLKGLITIKISAMLATKPCLGLYDWLVPLSLYTETRDAIQALQLV